MGERRKGGIGKLSRRFEGELKAVQGRTKTLRYRQECLRAGGSE
jgi:hypothetical protein